jgi:hypothetical protein
MRSKDGAKAKWTRRREQEQRAERALSLQKLGTRAVVAEALASEAENVERAVKLLCRSAGSGDLQATKALIPWLNQGLGMPTERVEHRSPSTLAEVQELSTAELQRLVAEGRERRLQALRAAPGTAGAEG